MAKTLTWAQAVPLMEKHCFKIFTPDGAGTGFLLTAPDSTDICGVATAHHVIAHAHRWDEPIQLVHASTRRELKLPADDNRFVFAIEERDLAFVMFQNNDAFPLEHQELELAAEKVHLLPGIDVGWAGFPAVSPNDFCFFKGCVSCYVEDRQRQGYLIDGVAINGVSGGPALTLVDEVPRIIGVVTQYLPNRFSRTGETLPGLCYVASVAPFHEPLRSIRSLDDARKRGELGDDALATGE